MNPVSRSNYPAQFGIAVVLSSLVLAGCDVIGDIFEAGVWVGVIGVVAVIALVVWLFAKAK